MKGTFALIRTRLIVLFCGALVALASLMTGYLWFASGTFVDEQMEQTSRLIYADRKEGVRNSVRQTMHNVRLLYETSQSVEALERREMPRLQSVTDMLVSQLTALYTRNVETQTPEALETLLKDFVRNSRYDFGNYFWIHDIGNTMVMHPITPELDGQDMSKVKDAKGLTLFAAMTKLALEQGQGMINYLWPKPGRVEAGRKLTFVKFFPEMGWIIGTGVWMDDVARQIQDEALERIAQTTFGDEYYFVLDLEHNMISHPDPRLLGRNLRDLKDKSADIYGDESRTVYIIQEMVARAKTEGKGFVDYFWPKLKGGVPIRKVSYVELFEPWGWVIGTGSYLDDVETSLDKEKAHLDVLRERMLFGGAGVTVCFLAVLLPVFVLGFRRDLGRPLLQLVHAARRMRSGEYGVDLSGRFIGELGVLRDAFRHMARSIQQHLDASEAKSREAEAEAEKAREASHLAEEARTVAQKVETYQREEIEKLALTLQAMAQGDLTVQYAAAPADGDIAEARENFLKLQAALSATTENLGRLLAKVRDASARLRSSSDGVLEVSGGMLDGAREMSAQSNSAAGSTEQMSMNINSMASAAEEMSVNVNTISSTAEEMSQTMDSVASSVEHLEQSITEIAGNAHEGSRITTQAMSMSGEATEAMRALGGAAKEIGKVTDVIKRIAEQTNLLALNATIEAASAGEAGRGFAVVAGEIKELANQSAKAAEDIAVKIQGVQRNTGDAVRVISEVAEIIGSINQSVTTITTEVETQNKAATAIAHSVDESNKGSGAIARSIAELANGANEMSRNAGEVAKGVNDVARSIVGVSDLAQSSAQGAGTVNESASSLAEMAMELEATVKTFKL